MKTEPNTEPDPYLRAFIDAIAERDRLKAANAEMLEALKVAQHALHITGYESQWHADAIEAVSAAIKKAEAL